MHINVWEASFYTEWVRQTQEETEAKKKKEKKLRPENVDTAKNGLK